MRLYRINRQFARTRIRNVDERVKKRRGKKATRAASAAT